MLLINTVYLLIFFIELVLKLLIIEEIFTLKLTSCGRLYVTLHPLYLLYHYLKDRITNKDLVKLRFVRLMVPNK